jgi:hypothetical protein
MYFVQTGMYSEFKYIQVAEDVVYVVCLWEMILFVCDNVCCGAPILKSVPLLVSNIHDIIPVHTQYILVRTCLYYYTFPVPVCTK